MAEIDIPEFLKPDDINDNEEVEIISEAEEVLIKNNDGTTTKKWQIEVKLPNGRIKVWTLNKTSAVTLTNKFGREMSNWIGKKIKITKVTQMVRGQQKDVLYASTEWD